VCESSHLSNFSALEVTLQPCCRMKSPTQVGLCFTSALLAAAASDLGCANDTEVPMGRSCHLARRADHRKDRAGQVRGSHQNLAREFRCSAASSTCLTFGFVLQKHCCIVTKGLYLCAVYHSVNSVECIARESKTT
jgi:hypothetical protein